MYSTCLFCYAKLRNNEAIETFPVGRQLAFHAERGRLWVVCTQCERWNLTPFEERWEAIEECERRFRDERKRIFSGNIGLARLDEGLELVRVGKPLHTEFAAWRYGDQFGKRRRRAAVRSAGLVALAGASVAGGLAIGVASLGVVASYPLVRRYLDERRRDRIVARIPRLAGGSFTVRGEHLGDLRVLPKREAAGGWQLHLSHDTGNAVIEEWEAVNAVALLAPRINVRGASDRVVKEAARRLETFDDPTQYFLPAAHVTDFQAPRNRNLMGLSPVTRLAIEMAANEENERHALEGDLALLELDWKEAEEVAAIADQLLVPAAVEREYDRMVAKHRRPGR